MEWQFEQNKITVQRNNTVFKISSLNPHPQNVTTLNKKYCNGWIDINGRVKC